MRKYPGGQVVGEKISQESKAWLVVVMFKRGGRVMTHDIWVPGDKSGKWKKEHTI